MPAGERGRSRKQEQKREESALFGNEERALFERRKKSFAFRPRPPICGFPRFAAAGFLPNDGFEDKPRLRLRGSRPASGSLS
jgi:hypothetical protein